jgi:hypothetical protein
MCGMTSHHLGAQPVPYTHSLRVAVTVDDEGAHVTGVQRVAMRAPASAPGAPAPEQSGLWFEVRGGDDELLYHRALRTPHADSVEVFDDPEGGTIHRAMTSRGPAKFDLIVPDLPDATHLAIYGAADRAQPRQPSVRLARVEMPALRRGEPS